MVIFEAGSMGRSRRPYRSRMLGGGGSHFTCGWGVLTAAGYLVEKAWDAGDVRVRSYSVNIIESIATALYD